MSERRKHESLFDSDFWRSYQPPEDDWSRKFAEAAARNLNANVLKEQADRKAGIKPNRLPDAPLPRWRS